MVLRLQRDARIATGQKGKPGFADGESPSASPRKTLPDQAALDFATWVAIASISGGDRQS
jgi:hypothetical protein